MKRSLSTNASRSSLDRLENLRRYQSSEPRDLILLKQVDMDFSKRCL
jgi:hypothetical protein